MVFAAGLMHRPVIVNYKGYVGGDLRGSVADLGLCQLPKNRNFLSPSHDELIDVFKPAPEIASRKRYLCTWAQENYDTYLVKNKAVLLQYRQQILEKLDKTDVQLVKELYKLRIIGASTVRAWYEEQNQPMPSGYMDDSTVFDGVVFEDYPDDDIIELDDYSNRSRRLIGSLGGSGGALGGLFGGSPSSTIFLQSPATVAAAAAVAVAKNQFDLKFLYPKASGRSSSDNLSIVAPISLFPVDNLEPGYQLLYDTLKSHYNARLGMGRFDFASSSDRAFWSETRFPETLSNQAGVFYDGTTTGALVTTRFDGRTIGLMPEFEALIKRLHLTSLLEEHTNASGVKWTKLLLTPTALNRFMQAYNVHNKRMSIVRSIMFGDAALEYKNGNLHYQAIYPGKLITPPASGTEEKIDDAEAQRAREPIKKTVNDLSHLKLLAFLQSTTDADWSGSVKPREVSRPTDAVNDILANIRTHLSLGEFAPAPAVLDNLSTAVLRFKYGSGKHYDLDFLMMDQDGGTALEVLHKLVRPFDATVRTMSGDRKTAVKVLSVSLVTRGST